ncbi:MAG: TIGR03364 family FAD-dependent oxidoreductase [Bacteroidota bacterium]|nr:TIGR03364 family FAD-dependent oxidoreductase [Bacteroidota bacterium]
MSQHSAIVIGAGIAGLATARALASRGWAVKVIERNDKAIGASVRNFGMIWPIGQPAGELYERAMLSRQIWKEVCDDAHIWYEEAGSLHLAYHPGEWKVLEELNEIYKYRGYELLNADETIQRSDAVIKKDLLGSLYSSAELIVDPRIAIAKIPAWLEEKYGVRFIWGRTVTDICYPAVYIGNDVMEADEIYVCSGADFETLYPQQFAEAPITKCKLQMMRLAAQPGNWRIGPALCGGLSLAHYESFKAAPSLQELKDRYKQEYATYLDWGIHVMVSQNQAGELTVGDSHEYGLTHEPFDRQFINQLVLDYLGKFAQFKDARVIETWNGIYPKLTNGQPDLVIRPEQGVTIINGLGGAGMTLGFGLCEQLIHQNQSMVMGHHHG